MFANLHFDDVMPLFEILMAIPTDHTNIWDHVPHKSDYFKNFNCVFSYLYFFQSKRSRRSIRNHISRSNIEGENEVKPLSDYNDVFVKTPVLSSLEHENLRVSYCGWSSSFVMCHPVCVNIFT